MSLNVTGRHQILVVLIKGVIVNWSRYIALCLVNEGWCNVSFRGTHAIGREQRLRCIYISLISACRVKNKVFRNAFRFF